jgi:hypothetical protein
MKAEQFFHLILREVYGVSEADATQHFRDFRKRYRRIPQIAESLDREVVSNDGTALSDADISRLIADLKQGTEPPIPHRAFVNHDISLIGLYLQELGVQLRFARRCYANYLLAMEGEDVDSTFLHIHHFVVHAANVDKLLDKMLSQFQGEVGNSLEEWLDLADIDLKSFRALRNHLEHFEERLDAWHYLHLGSPIIDMNLVTSRTRGLPEERCLRLLRTDENIFVVLGERFDLLDLYRQVCSLADMLPET